MKTELTGKRAIVCGSTQGIGRAAAQELAGLGAEITLVARNHAALQQACTELPAIAGQKHCFLVADFSDPENLQKQITDHIATKSPIHILVNNTGGPPAGPALDAATESFTSGFTQHLLCNQILTQALVPGMKSAGYGRVINIISTSVKQPIAGLGVSNTIRGAVASWAKTLAGELGPFGITVNNVLPGATNTGRLHTLIDNIAKRNNKSAEEIADNMRASIPARRFAEPEELAGAIAFLASPAASYINGINLPVDGGRTLSL